MGTSLHQPPRTRVCRHSSQGNEGGGEMDGGGKTGRGLVVTRGNASELLESLKAVFDQVAPLVHLCVMRDRRLTIRLGRNDCYGAAFIQTGAQGVAIECFVCNERGKIDIADQGLDADAVMPLTGKKNEANEIAQGIGERHDLRGQAAA